MKNSNHSRRSQFILLFSIIILIVVYFIKANNKQTTIINSENIIEIVETPLTASEQKINNEVQVVTDEIKKYIVKKPQITNALIDQQMNFVAIILSAVEFDKGEEECGLKVKREIWKTNADFACVTKLHSRSFINYIPQYYINNELVLYESYFGTLLEPVSFENELIDNRFLHLNLANISFFSIIFDQNYIIKNVGYDNNSFKTALKQIDKKDRKIYLARIIMMVEKINEVFELLKSQCGKLGNEYACGEIEANNLRSMQNELTHIIQSAN